jgi:multidrug efflux system membrane fusion protein
VAGFTLKAILDGRHKGDKGPRPVPVVTAQVRQGDMEVSLTGLGTVAALNTAVVHARVDGYVVSLPFQEGQIVRQGQLLAQLDPRPYDAALHQAEAQLARDEANLKNGRLDLARYQTLARQGIIPSQQLDTQVSTVDQMAAAVKADQAQVETAKLNVTYSRVTAPISGRVGLRAVDLGNLVHATDTAGFCTLTQIQPITVVFTLPSDEIPLVQAHLQAGRPLAADAYDREDTTCLAHGSLMALDNLIDPATGTLKFKALYQNDDNRLYPNQFVNIHLRVDTLHGAVIIPTAAVQRSARGAFVWVMKAGANNTFVAEMRPVEVAMTHGEETVISRGAAPGEALVIDGVDKLRTGIPIATRSAAPPNGSKDRS